MWCYQKSGTIFFIVRPCLTLPIKTDRGKRPNFLRLIQHRHSIPTLLCLRLWATKIQKILKKERSMHQYHALKGCQLVVKTKYIQNILYSKKSSETWPCILEFTLILTPAYEVLEAWLFRKDFYIGLWALAHDRLSAFLIVMAGCGIAYDNSTLLYDKTDLVFNGCHMPSNIKIEVSKLTDRCVCLPCPRGQDGCISGQVPVAEESEPL